jgi:dephospho-CoA kinase
MTIAIALTGGIGAGKTTTCEYFKLLGAPIISTDQISRTLVEPGTKAFNKIVSEFGEDILNKDLTLNRRFLRDIIFSSKEKQAWLENLLHPLIMKKIIKEISLVDYHYCIVEIPLLIDPSFIKIFDRILVVDCEVHLQKVRTMSRDQCSMEDLDKIIAVQPSRTQRIKISHDIIINDFDLVHLEQSVYKLHKKYIKLPSKISSKA